MRNRKDSPTVLQDLNVLADLYRTVFWMMGRRLPMRPKEPPYLPVVDLALLCADEDEAALEAEERALSA